MKIEFYVPGVPRPGGSKRGYYIAKLKRVVITETCKNEDWKTNCTFFARQAYPGFPLTGPLHLEITFVMPRPKGHYRKNGTLKPNAPHFHTSKPDATKLTRSTEDAITSVIWSDDSHVAEQSIRKVYGEKPGAHVVVTSLSLAGGVAQEAMLNDSLNRPRTCVYCKMVVPAGTYHDCKDGTRSLAPAGGGKGEG